MIKTELFLLMFFHGIKQVFLAIKVRIRKQQHQGIFRIILYVIFLSYVKSVPEYTTSIVFLLPDVFFHKYMGFFLRPQYRISRVPPPLTYPLLSLYIYISISLSSVLPTPFPTPSHLLGKGVGRTEERYIYIYIQRERRGQVRGGGTRDIRY